MHRKPFFFVIFFVLAGLGLPVFAADALETKLPTINLKIGSIPVKLELAATESERTQGLMFRRKLDKDAGMLFDFNAPARVCMWMKNTYIPLSVAFIDQDGIILNIEDMEPLTTNSHCSKGWIRYAVEMNQGWFSARQLKAGTKVEGLPIRNNN